jgi:predicted ATP-binding protein involved in virulence
MKIQKLTISNFRGFEQLEIDFSSDDHLKKDDKKAKDKVGEAIVIAGINGVGKSALLQSISKISSYLLPEVTTAKRENNSFIDRDIHAGKLTLSVSALFNMNDNLEVLSNISRTQLDPSRVVEIQEERESIRTQRRYVEKDSTEDLELEERLRELSNLLKSSSDYFSWQADKERLKTGSPLVVYYSTNRSLSRLPPHLSPVKALTIANAYTNSLFGSEVSLNDFANWYRVVKRGLFGSKKVGREILEMLEGVIQKMMPNFHNLQLVESSNPYFTIKKQKAVLPLEQLSDGERGLLALTFDLTRRLTTANPKSNNPVEEGSAIVLIDEVELHLHPTWQRQVMRRLTSTFRNCQFIVTTHSPQVIGQTKPEKLRLLHEKDGLVSVTIPGQSFGMDSSWILQNIMGAAARDIKTEQDLGAIFDAIDEENYPQARELIWTMSEELGDFPELQEASSLLDRLELLEEVYEED